MFKYYKDISDVVTLVAYCLVDRTYLLSKDSTGELWLPWSKTENNCWKMTAQKINFELFGVDAVACAPLRIYRIWLPSHTLPCVYHAVYKVLIKPDVKKKINKAKSQSIRGRLQWYSMTELERQRAHNTLRSPEVWVFAQTVLGEQSKDMDAMEMEAGMLIEICEDNIIVGAEGAAGAVALTSPHSQLLQAAGYTRDDLQDARVEIQHLRDLLANALQCYAKEKIELAELRAATSELVRLQRQNAELVGFLIEEGGE